MDVWDDGYVNIVCVWVCVHAKMLTLRWSSPMGGGGSSLLVRAISERANFHLKEHSAPLCLPFLPIPLQLRPPPSPSSSVSAISMISTPLSWPSLSLSLSHLPQNAPKAFILMLSWMLFVHHTRVFFLFFECAESSSLFLRSSRLATEKCRACKGGGWKKGKTRQKAEWQNRWEWNRSACLNVRWQEPDCSPSRQRKGSEFWVLPL